MQQHDNRSGAASLSSFSILNEPFEGKIKGVLGCKRLMKAILMMLNYYSPIVRMSSIELTEVS